jgi:hypothetical protein
MQQTAERRQKKQKRKAEEGKLQVKRKEMDNRTLIFSAAETKARHIARKETRSC